MSNTKFTPGPWVAYLNEPKLNNGHATVESASGSHIMDVAVYKSNRDEKFANANLIAVAPEMYDILNRMAEDDDCQMYINDIKAMLAQVRGGS